MVLTAPDRRLHPAWFFAPAAGIVAVAALLAGRLDGLPDAGPLTWGLVIDLGVLIPALYAWVMVRGRGASKSGIVTAALFGLVAARLLLPEEHLGALRGLPMVAVGAEAGLLGWVIYRLIRGRKRAAEEGDRDLYDRLRSQFREALPATAAGVFAYETALFAHALRPRQPKPAAPNTWTYHRTSGYGAILVALLMAGVGELIAGHLLLMRFWGPTAAWVHFALSGYGLLWLLGDYRATRSRPHRVTDDALVLRCGLRGQTRVPWNAVRSVEAFDWRRESPTGAAGANLAVLGRPDLVIELGEATEVVGFYGRTRSVTTLGVSADDPDGLRRAVRERLSAGGSRTPAGPARG